jgi:hypothetical protein
MKGLSYLLLPIIVMLSAGVQLIYTQADANLLKDKRLITLALKPRLKQYLVYYQYPKSPKMRKFWSWIRDIKIETRSRQKVFVIAQLFARK